MAALTRATPEPVAAVAEARPVFRVEDTFAMGKLGEVQIATIVHLKEDRALIGERKVDGFGEDTDTGLDGRCLMRGWNKGGVTRTVCVSMPDTRLELALHKEGLPRWPRPEV